MGNCTTCDDPTIYESNTETKPIKNKIDNQENIHVTPITHKVLKKSENKSHIRNDLVKLTTIPDFGNPFT